LKNSISFLPKAVPITMIVKPTAIGIRAFATSLFRLFDSAQSEIRNRAVERT
jgi:hypothetical protein